MAAHLAAEVNADLLILMSDVDGVYNRPPGAEDSKLISVFTPNENVSGDIKFGAKSSVGLGGMESKVSFAILFALIFLGFSAKEGKEKKIFF